MVIEKLEWHSFNERPCVCLANQMCPLFVDLIRTSHELYIVSVYRKAETRFTSVHGTERDKEWVREKGRERERERNSGHIEPSEIAPLAKAHPMGPITLSARREANTVTTRRLTAGSSIPKPALRTPRNTSFRHITMKSHPKSSYLSKCMCWLASSSEKGAISSWDTQNCYNQELIRKQFCRHKRYQWLYNHERLKSVLNFHHDSE